MEGSVQGAIGKEGRYELSSVEGTRRAGVPWEKKSRRDEEQRHVYLIKLGPESGSLTIIMELHL